MSRVITQRQLRNESGQIMRELDRGESFIVTRNGVPVGELHPVCRRRFVPTATAMETFSGAPALDSARFRSEVDLWLGQDIEPRG